jgi:hypothetical protein
MQVQLLLLLRLLPGRHMQQAAAAADLGAAAELYR